MNPFDIQHALKAAGFDPGEIDGAIGRRTQRAIKDFQRARGLDVDGIVGPKTRRALFPQRVEHGREKPVWFMEAERLKGLREIPGARSNPTILAWAKRLGGWVASFYRNDDTPWCGLFAAHVVGLTLPDEPLPANPLSALAWAKFGVPLSRPAPGCVCVFKRKGGGHVGFYVGEDAAAIHVLGGNQSNAVTVTRIGSDRLVEFRWPSTAPLPVLRPVLRAASTVAGGLSRNEA